LTARLWVDVEDLFEYANGHSRPSGIQRVAFEIYRVLQAKGGGTGLVQFVRHDNSANSFRVVPWHDVATLFDRLTQHRTPPQQDPSPGISPHPLARRLFRIVVHRMPPSLRAAVIDAVLAQRGALRAWGQLVRALWICAQQGLKYLQAQVHPRRTDIGPGHVEPGGVYSCSI